MAFARDDDALAELVVELRWPVRKPWPGVLRANGVGVTHLLGYAAGSPLTQQQTAVSASLGVAYRWGAKYEGLTSVLVPAAEQPR